MGDSKTTLLLLFTLCARGESWNLLDDTDLNTNVHGKPYSDGPVQSPSPILPSTQCIAVPSLDRIDCQPNVQGLNQQQCEAHGCCWDSAVASGTVDGIGQPSCFLPPSSGYTLGGVQNTTSGFEGLLRRIRPISGQPASMFGGDIESLHLSVNFESAQSVRVRITDPNDERYEVPLPLPEHIEDPVHPRDAEIAVKYVQNPFSIVVTRKSNGAVLFDTTDVGTLVYSNQYLQWSSRLSSSTLYGLGEHTLPLNIADAAGNGSVGEGRSDMAEAYQLLAQFSRDQPTGSRGFSGANFYGDHPFYINFDDDGTSGNAHGVFLLNSNAKEILLQGAGGRKKGRILTWRTIGGIIDLRIFAGPSPGAVVRQYTDVIGRPFMPPYWALGFHLCRWGYGSSNRTKQITDGMIAAGIPLDTQWNDIDYMFYSKDFQYDKMYHYPGLPDMVKDLHDKGMRYILIVDPGISSHEAPGSYPPYDDGVDRNVFIKDARGNVLHGDVWPGQVVYPDFFHVNATAWWQKAIGDFHTQVPFDGLWIDMNEASNFKDGAEGGCPTNGTDGALEHPPYVPMIFDRNLATKTLCMSAKQTYPPNSPSGRTTQYNTHSLYGYSESIATFTALKNVRGNRTIVISRSTFPNSGAHTGHWLGDNAANWDEMALSIPGSMAFNIFGIPLVGPDICGFGGVTTPELCARWMQLGAFYPFSRNHNTAGTPDQDPPSLGEPVVSASKMALNTRYELLPYLYTLFFLAHRDGDTVMRPLSFEFPDDASFRSADRQFLWGSSLLITPVLTQGATSVTGFVPSNRGTKWYSYYSGELLVAANRDQRTSVKDGCFTLNRTACCNHFDGRIGSKWYGSECLPAAAGHFTSGNVCEPRCWVEGGCDSPYPQKTAGCQSHIGTAVMDAPLTGPINLHVRSGSVIPTQKPNTVAPITTANSRGNPFGLTIAIDADGHAEGLIYFDDGESLDSIDTGRFTLLRILCAKGVINSKIEAGTKALSSETLGSVRILGLASQVTSVTVQGAKLDASKWSYDANLGVLLLSDLAVPLSTALAITFNSGGDRELFV